MFDVNNRIQLDYFNQIATVDDSPIKAQIGGSCCKPLPEAFLPGKWDVLCCGGKEGSEHVGNKRYRLFIENNVEAYRNAKSKHHKSMLVSNIVASVKEAAVDGLGGFVKKDPLTGRWYEVEDKIAREKVSHALRDAIKVQKRKEARQSRINHRLDTRVTPNKRGHKYLDTLDAKIDLGNVLSSTPSKCYDDSHGGYSKGSLVSGNVKDCLFGDLWTIIGSDNDDWERSLKESTERFLKSEEGDLSCWKL